MKLLLLLSALLTGITGVIAGGRQAEAQQVELSAATQVVDVAIAVAGTAVKAASIFTVTLLVALVFFLLPLARWRVRTATMPRESALGTERRLE